MKLLCVVLLCYMAFVSQQGTAMQSMQSHHRMGYERHKICSSARSLVADHLACHVNVSPWSPQGQNIVPDHKIACMMSDVIVNDKPAVDVWIGVTLACPVVTLACPGATLACSGITLACPGVTLACPGVTLACPGATLACPGATLACPGVTLACPGVNLACPALLVSHPRLSVPDAPRPHGLFPRGVFMHSMSACCVIVNE